MPSDSEPLKYSVEAAEITARGPTPIGRLEAEVEQLRQDAARWRYVRDNLCHWEGTLATPFAKVTRRYFFRLSDGWFVR